jgi:hypothetical protein
MPTFAKFLERNKFPETGLTAAVSRQAWNAALSSVVMCATEETAKRTEDHDPLTVGELRGITVMSGHATKLMAD